MFARAVRSSCRRLPQRPQGIYGLARISNQNQLRILTTSRSLRDSQKTTATSPIQPKTASTATTKKSDVPGVQKLVAETKSAPKKKTEDILNTSAATNKEQRKADWAIMKDLAKYLWPKVWSCQYGLWNFG
jgi:ABC transporter ATM